MLDGVQWSTFPILTVRSVEAGPVIGEIFGHTNRLRSEFLQVQPVGYMLTTFGFLLLNWGIFFYIYIPLNWSVIFLQSWTSTSYFSNSTSSSVTNCQFSPILPRAGHFSGHPQFSQAAQHPDIKLRLCGWCFKNPKTVDWIAIVDISPLNSDSDWKHWHFKDLIDMCVDLSVVYPDP